MFRPGRGMSIRPLLPTCAALFAVLAGACWIVGPTDSAQAQQAVAPPAAKAPVQPAWRTMPIDPSMDKNARRIRSQVLKILRDGDISGDGRFGQEEQDQLTQYYGQYALRRWTLPEYFTELAGAKEQLASTTRGLRAELQTELASCSNQDAFNFLTQRSLAFMQYVVKSYPEEQGNFHPATRVNAMLMIGELGATPPPGFGQTPPPLPEATQVMLTHLQDPEQIDAVRVAALVGIVRHATLGGITDPQIRQTVVTTMVRVVNSAPPPGRSLDGHMWMRSQAAEILGKVGVAAGGTTTALGAMVADIGLPISIRCVAARALGQLDYSGAGDLNASQLIVPLGRLADAAIAEEDLDALLRDRIKARLSSAQQGLAGLAAVAVPPHQDLYTKTRTPVVAILAALDDRRIKGPDLKKLIEQNHQQLRAALGPAPGATPAPTPPATPAAPETSET